MDYAKEHGIALIQVFDHSCISVSHSVGPDAVTTEDDPITYLEKRWPKYRAVCFMPEYDEPVVLYPTREIVDKLYSEVGQMMKQRYEWII